MELACVAVLGADRRERRGHRRHLLRLTESFGGSGVMDELP
jgi:hypothetical protein